LEAVITASLDTITTGSIFLSDEFYLIFVQNRCDLNGNSQ